MDKVVDRASKWTWKSSKQFFSGFGLFISLISVFSVALNGVTFHLTPGFDIGIIYFVYCVIGIVLGYLSNSGGLFLFLLLLPIVPNLHNQLAALFGSGFISLSNPGLDLASGFVLGWGGRFFIKRPPIQKFPFLPWQIGLLLTYLGFSTLLALIRNLRQSASGTSIEGVLYNLIHFRPYAWHDDFMPLADLISYGVAGAVLACILPFLLETKDRNQIVFRPLILGLFLATVIGCFQAFTGFGLPEAYLNFRKDALGFVAIGFQPDIHAYAGHLLLGAVGLWAYLNYAKGSKEKAWIYFVIGMSWVALVLSKSRASLALAIISVAVLLLVSFWFKRRQSFKKLIWFVALCISLAFVALLYAKNHPQILSGGGWLADLLNHYLEYGMSGLNSGTQNFGGRPEIYLAGLRMFSQFPILGLGQGGFFRQSADIGFSKSFMLSHWGGENAHNYFLQVLVENGLIGILLFGLAIISPYFLTQSKRVLFPSALGLASLLLGNIFAHSFLIRENLILASVLLALLYAEGLGTQAREESLNTLNKVISNKLFVLLGALILGLLIAGGAEAYHSFYRPPYQIGQRCFVSRPITADGWSSGILEIPLPANTHGFRVHIATVGRPDLHRRPLQARMDVAYYEQYSHDHPPLATVFHEWKSASPGVMEIRLRDNTKLANGNGKAVLRLSNCFNPRNYGISPDARNLGVLVEQIEVY